MADPSYTIGALVLLGLYAVNLFLFLKARREI